MQIQQATGQLLEIGTLNKGLLRHDRNTGLFDNRNNLS